jgi:1-phosphofructokinase family hexose kinase
MNGRLLDSLIRLTKENCQRDDFIILTGSLPPGCPQDTYARLMRVLPVPCVLDAYGEALRVSLSASPFLVKPNLQELQEQAGRKLESLGEIRTAALDLIKEGARNVLVSMGGRGALLVNPSGALFSPGLRVPVSSTVGAGDAMTAGFVAGFAETGSFREALRCGTAAGAASVMTDGTQLIRREDYDALLDKAEVWGV